MNRWKAAGCALLALSLAGWAVDARMFLACWLAAWWWSLGLALGAFTNAWMHRLAGGSWGERIVPAALALGSRVPWLLLGALPILAGLSHLYPWAAEPRGAWLTDIRQPGFVEAWLSEPFFAARLALYAIAWAWLCRPASLLSKQRAAVSMMVHAAVTSLASVDLLMSLVPGWYSTGFGLRVLAAQALGGSAFAVLAAARGLPSAERVPSAGHPPVARDLGNLLLMWTLVWAYLAFMEFLVIWAENLPREIQWFVPRLQSGWRFAALALVVLQLAVPTLALLFRSVKDRPRRLRAVALVVLCASALDTVWLVLPSVDPHGLHGLWIAPAMFVGVALLLRPAPEPATEAMHAHA
ncbi:MAG TPA: hypothetical protein VHA82_21125 [Ramlibacter sp.]|uniref:hypothetical protein n=1 Tax=Ramlibacter sp. TaxID=1917967 RepID=UPI002C6D1CAF|nr:hypothetical protein [Ramlibacter sp.]HVZ46321.1 hypothetical protein [Ramlibacter sp.]